MQQLNGLQDRLGYTFRDTELLKTALTHSSYANEKKQSGISSNERLEYLGDSVLGMTVALYIFNEKSNMPEGQMTRLRSEIVCEKSLATLAIKLRIGECMQLGRGEEKGGGRKRPSLLADALEAILAAMFIDGGFEPVMKLVSEHFGSHVYQFDQESTDYKTSLQEIIQEKSGQKLSYHIIDEKGPDHEKLYTVEVRLNGSVIGSGMGRSKKGAEQSAARVALAELSR